MAQRKIYCFDLTNRLNQACEQSGLSNEQIGKRAGLSRKQIYAYRNGVNTPNAFYMAKICLVLGVSADWILLGKGEMK